MANNLINHACVIKSSLKNNKRTGFRELLGSWTHGSSWRMALSLRRRTFPLVTWTPPKLRRQVGEGKQVLFKTRLNLFKVFEEDRDISVSNLYLCGFRATKSFMRGEKGCSGGQRQGIHFTKLTGFQALLIVGNLHSSSLHSREP